MQQNDRAEQCQVLADEASLAYLEAEIEWLQGALYGLNCDLMTCPWGEFGGDEKFHPQWLRWEIKHVARRLKILQNSCQK